MNDTFCFGKSTNELICTHVSRMPLMLDLHCSLDYFKNHNEALMFPKLGLPPSTIIMIYINSRGRSTSIQNYKEGR